MSERPSEGFRLGVREAIKAARSAAVMPHVNWGRVQACERVLSAGELEEKVRLLLEISGPSFRLTEAVTPVTHEVDERLHSLALAEVLRQSGAQAAQAIERACCEWIDTGFAAPGVRPRESIGSLVEQAEQRLGLLARFAPALGTVQALQGVPDGVRENLRAARDAKRERTR
jgi:hypothetical protein